MKYDDMQAIMRRLDNAVGGHWCLYGDGPKRIESPFGTMAADGKWWLENYRPWKAGGEAAPGLTIGTTANTEPIGRLSGYLMCVRENADFIIHAPDDMRMLITEIVRLNAMLIALGKGAPESYDRVLNESGKNGNFGIALAATK